LAVIEGKNMSPRSRFTVAATAIGAAIALISPTGSSYAMQAPPIQATSPRVSTPIQYREDYRQLQNSNPYGGYHVNRYGYGNYFAGPEGYGGYPAGSAGAQELRNEQRYKCRDLPESC
jgi:hypothetical protein